MSARPTGEPAPPEPAPGPGRPAAPRPLRESKGGDQTTHQGQSLDCPSDRIQVMGTLRSQVSEVGSPTEEDIVGNVHLVRQQRPLRHPGDIGPRRPLPAAQIDGSPWATMPTAAFNNVDFPAPFGPINPPIRHRPP